MTSSDIIGLAITVVIGLVIITMSIMLLLGKGSNLIAGYNSMPATERKKFDEKALCKFIGKVFLPIGIFTPAIAVGGILKIGWIGGAYAGTVCGLIVFALIYCNTGKRFRK